MSRKFHLLFFCFALIAVAVQGFPISTETRQRSQQQAPLLRATKSDVDVAIFGGGFGGLYTALALSREAKAKGKSLDIALIDPSHQFVFTPLLYDLTVGTASPQEVCPKYAEVLRGTGVRHIAACFEDYASPKLNSALLKTKESTIQELSFRSSVVCVGATPESSLQRVPGALKYSQPFYTQQNSQETSQLLQRLENDSSGQLNIAIIGGGYGGVELAACVKRRMRKANVKLLTRGPPMQGTRAEKLVDQALKRLGVEVEIGSVQEITKGFDEDDRVIIKQSGVKNRTETASSEELWDAVLWTAGAGPSSPISALMQLSKVESSGRLAVDESLRCFYQEESTIQEQPSVWALGDCAEIVGTTPAVPTVPKTAQAAMQQAEVVANNVLAELEGTAAKTKKFKFQDLGTMLTLGGPNGAVLAPVMESPLAPLFTPLINTARVGLGIADDALLKIGKSNLAESAGLLPVTEKLETLGLSLGGYGLGIDSSSSGDGTLAGTLTGAARRAVYAIRMPTNRQKMAAATSAAIFTAAGLAREASQMRTESNDNDETQK